MENKYNVRTGLQRFMDKFPYWPTRKEVKVEEEIEYLGVGAMMVPPIRNITKELSDQLFKEDMSDY